MGISQYDPAALGRPAWNAGKQVGVKKPLKQRKICAVCFFLDREGRMRDRARSISPSTASSAAAICQKSKLGPSSRATKFELERWSFRRPAARGGTVDDYVSPQSSRPPDHLSTRQHARLVDEWVTGIWLRRQDHGTHSLRRTKAALIQGQWQPPSDPDPAWPYQDYSVRYLGVDIDLAERTEI